MGRRRIRDLTALGVAVDSYDITDGLFDGKTRFGYADLVVVSTPPLTKRTFGIRDKAIFIEADVEVVEWPHFPSATPLFCEDVQRVMGEKVGSVAAYTFHLGQNLRDWHPSVDLRTYYAAQRETGACREMVPFELIWLTKWQGPIRHAYAVRGNRAGIADIDDVYQVVLEHESGALGHLLIEVLSRPAIRRITIVGTRATVERDISYTEADYFQEMSALVRAVKGEQTWPYSQEQERANLDVLRKIERV